MWCYLELPWRLWAWVHLRMDHNQLKWPLMGGEHIADGQNLHEVPVRQKYLSSGVMVPTITAFLPAPRAGIEPRALYSTTQAIPQPLLYRYVLSCLVQKTCFSFLYFPQYWWLNPGLIPAKQALYKLATISAHHLMSSLVSSQAFSMRYTHSR